LNVNHTPMLDLNAWAANQLEVDGGLPAGELRRALLEKLAGCDFLPPRSWGPASSVMLRPTEPLSSPAMAVAWAEESAQQAERVEAFAAGLFDFPMEQRQVRWNDLRERCAFSPSLAFRLDGLKNLLPLSADGGAEASAECGRLARELAGALTRPFAGRDEEFQAIIERWKTVAEAPGTLVGELRERNPELSGLVRPALSAIAGYTGIDTRFVQADAGAFGFSTVSTGAAVIQPTPWVDQPRRRSSGSAGKTAGIPLIFIVVVIGILRALGTAARTDPKPTFDYNSLSYPTGRQWYRDPNLNPPLHDDWRNGKSNEWDSALKGIQDKGTREQIEQILREQEQKQLKEMQDRLRTDPANPSRSSRRPAGPFVPGDPPANPKRPGPPP
jgi:hypothetical protein